MFSEHKRRLCPLQTGGSGGGELPASCSVEIVEEMVTYRGALHNVGASFHSYTKTNRLNIDYGLAPC